MTNEFSRGIGAVLFECFKVAEAAVFVDECVLEVPTVDSGITYQTGSRNEFNVYLNALTGILHLLIWFGYVFGIWELNSHLVSFS